ncbi:isochorismatase family protein [Aromatoleum toluclasticum]|uniref:isochorismatase family protein n=1 Tax=Aromatoleum toluclasticum TaxID=92003 RepID=UPI001D19771E|nr:isochorismatase family protein [Aromatoleum toluclasticum]MCC4117775.1 isochorismatase family protein [Aromatoleum toluclasticum]
MQSPAAPITLQPGDALLIVDVQNDFLPGGSLAVRQGDDVVAPLNALIARCTQLRLPVVATRDWHPTDHCSFRERGGPWPPHCVAGTPGAAFAPPLALPGSATIVSKAVTPDLDAYSGFGGTDLHDRLQAAGVRRLLVGGLATDYCVLNTVRDGLANGYEVILLTDAIRAVDVTPGDGQRAIDEMTRLGARAIASADIGNPA